MKLVSIGSINKKKSSLVQVKAWCRKGDKPLTEKKSGLRSLVHLSVTGPASTCGDFSLQHNLNPANPT